MAAATLTFSMASTPLTGSKAFTGNATATVAKAGSWLRVRCVT